jgi:putative transposase
MISTQDRIILIELIKEAISSGARIDPACDILGISIRTYCRTAL